MLEGVCGHPGADWCHDLHVACGRAEVMAVSVLRLGPCPKVPTEQTLDLKFPNARGQSNVLSNAAS